MSFWSWVHAKGQLVRGVKMQHETYTMCLYRFVDVSDTRAHTHTHRMSPKAPDKTNASIASRVKRRDRNRSQQRQKAGTHCATGTKALATCNFYHNAMHLYRCVHVSHLGHRHAHTRTHTNTACRKRRRTKQTAVLPVGCQPTPLLGTDCHNSKRNPENLG